MKFLLKTSFLVVLLFSARYFPASRAASSDRRDGLSSPRKRRVTRSKTTTPHDYCPLGTYDMDCRISPTAKVPYKNINRFAPGWVARTSRNGIFFVNFEGFR